MVRKTIVVDIHKVRLCAPCVPFIPLIHHLPTVAIYRSLATLPLLLFPCIPPLLLPCVSLLFFFACFVYLCPFFLFPVKLSREELTARVKKKENEE